MARSPWSVALQWGLWVVAMTAIMGWLARSRTRTRPADDARRMAHPISTLIIGVVSALLFGGIALASVIWQGKSGSVWATLVFVGFALTGIPLILDYWNARHTLNDDGMDYGTMWGRSGTLRWRDVRRLSYSPVWKWFRLDGAQGQVVKISAMVRGLPEFAQAVLTQVPATAMDGETRAVLEETAKGNPPSLWH